MVPFFQYIYQQNERFLNTMELIIFKILFNIKIKKKTNFERHFEYSFISKFLLKQFTDQNYYDIYKNYILLLYIYNIYILSK